MDNSLSGDSPIEESKESYTPFADDEIIAAKDVPTGVNLNLAHTVLCTPRFSLRFCSRSSSVNVQVQIAFIMSSQ